ncbi:MAG: tetratricopeptide repeat protein [Thermosynechococcaceae cyanobacterium MS004]|jgi:tetratricopeptide (TPR) repeat protein|nr:tetratricopeptide repeat protein [Thermosynechococcaceae cyanobacterium MS004]
MDDVSVDDLLEDLKASEPKIRDRATQALWEFWFWQKGITGLEKLQQCQEFLDAGEIQTAEWLLTQVIEALPDFAEAWNRRAVLYYAQHQYEKSIQDCHEVIRLVPFHFGALHGLGLCHAALGNYPAAIQAFHRALDVQPHALINQKLMLECMALL